MGHWVAGGIDTDGGTNGKLAEIAGNVGAWTGKTANIEGGAIFPYIKSSQIFICPSNKDGQDKRLTYSMNCAMAGTMDAAVDEPTQIVLLLDEEKANDGYVYLGANATDAMTQIHNETGNLLFVDGHVKSLPFKAFPLNAADTSGLRARDEGGPRFRLSKGYDLATDHGFGSCSNPAAAATPAPTPGPTPIVAPTP
ncbi:hypothetical protein EON80_15055 [bacterium]|nr:MAG: hypothetical protein EON80_15055 [bacterium]